MSQLACPKGCVRHVTRYTNGLATFVGPSLSGVPEQKSARQVAVPPAMRRDYDDMVARTVLHANPPTLEFYADLHGVGGMFIPAQWAIIVGVKDQRDIASGVIAAWPAQVRNIYAHSNGGRRPTPAELSQFTFEAAIRRCMGHEIGHALIAHGLFNPYAPDEEAGADYFAGKFDAASGRNRDMGEMFFYSIGCTGPSCTHPEPDTRAAAYVAGFDQQQAA